MRIVLIKDHEKLGKAGKVLEVKDGFARNYLIPQGYALPENSASLKKIQEEMRLKELKQKRALQKSIDLANKLKSITITIPVQVGEEDRVFGSVTNQQIAEQLNALGYDIDKRQIILDEPLKALGMYEIPIKIHSDITATIKVFVVRA